MKARQAALCLCLLFLLPAAAAAGGNENAEIAAPAASAGSTARTAPLETVPPEPQRWPMTAVAAPAQEDGAVALRARPDERAETIMSYYAGTRVTVLREAGADFVLAQVGSPQAGAMGYIRRSELRLGSAALRELAPAYTMIELNRDADVYAWCDEGSGVIGSFAAGERFFTIGKNDGRWVQIAVPENSIVTRPDVYEWRVTDAQGTRADGTPGITGGFVRMETGLGRGYLCVALRWEVEPVPGEITREQAIALAVGAALELELPQAFRSQEALAAAQPQALWLYSPPGQGFVQLAIDVSFQLDDVHTVSVSVREEGGVSSAVYAVDGVMTDWSGAGGLP